MKTAISLPDDLFEHAEQLARRLGKSRSELYREALYEYVSRHNPSEITRLYNELADEIDTGLDVFGREAARRTLERVEW